MPSGSGMFANKKPLKTLPQHGEQGEIYDLRRDLKELFAPMANVVVEEFTDVPAASTAGIRIATATVASPVVVAASGLVGGAAVTLPYPRPISVTTAGVTPADAPATVTVTGLDVDGKALSETITVPQTAATGVGSKCFKTVTGLSFPAADGTAATVAVGWGAPIGLSEDPISRAGLVAPISEIAVGTKVTTGTLSLPATNAPHGMYTPATAANGTNDYAIYYEATPS